MRVFLTIVCLSVCLPAFADSPSPVALGQCSAQTEPELVSAASAQCKRQVWLGEAQPDQAICGVGKGSAALDEPSPSQEQFVQVLREAPSQCVTF
jgi:hypothetical protein